MKVNNHRIGYLYREEDGLFLGYMKEYPNYWTQGKTKEDLEEHLLDIYKELTGSNPVTISPLRADELQLT